jgi:hypothetical protein
MMEDETMVYYVRNIGGPNFAIQANSREEYRAILHECYKDYPEAKFSRVEVMTPSEYRHLYG